MKHPYGMLFDKPATIDDWFFEQFIEASKRRVVDGPVHNDNGPNDDSDPCPACKAEDEWLTLRTKRQERVVMPVTMGIARFVWNAHQRPLDVKPDDKLAETGVNICHCYWCNTWRDYLLIAWDYEHDQQTKFQETMASQLANAFVSGQAGTALRQYLTRRAQQTTEAPNKDVPPPPSNLYP